MKIEIVITSRANETGASLLSGVLFSISSVSLFLATTGIVPGRGLKGDPSQPGRVIYPVVASPPPDTGTITPAARNITTKKFCVPSHTRPKRRQGYKGKLEGKLNRLRINPTQAPATSFPNATNVPQQPATGKTFTIQAQKSVTTFLVLGLK